MGQVVRKDRAAEDIVEDADKTLTNARSRGGRWQELAEARLAPSYTWFNDINEQRESADRAHAPRAAAIVTAKDQADRKIAKAHDIIWNEVGRPAQDAAFSVLFPDGTGSYSDGETAEQPDRMRVLVTLLGSNIHPKLSRQTATTCAAEILADAELLGNALTAGRETGARVKVLSRVRTALARVVHADLTSLKRLYKAEGFSEAEIHMVIPDRPSKTKKDDDEP